ncbi:hypothetical protein BT67DRAFT_133618 [Trichocladium antarcticum]|uniref:Uncharacterized protein n=1 Tax=Trichocladium antarcticum TaxID=1450529 RepID=A0AAN6ZC65_9PEZI|nr:hypothetical protein BT67DRAFT_133618 [Trichocladium antarcticum]
MSAEEYFLVLILGSNLDSPSLTMTLPRTTAKEYKGPTSVWGAEYGQGGVTVSGATGQTHHARDASNLVVRLPKALCRELRKPMQLKPRSYGSLAKDEEAGTSLGCLGELVRALPGGTHPEPGYLKGQLGLFQGSTNTPTNTTPPARSTPSKHAGSSRASNARRLVVLAPADSSSARAMRPIEDLGGLWKLLRCSHGVRGTNNIWPRP